MVEKINDKIVIGYTEHIHIYGPEGKDMKVEARIDTGATKSSIDSSLAAKLKLGPIVGTKMVKSANGESVRPLIHVKLLVGKKEVEGEFSIADRNRLKFPVLIGQDIISQGFIIDPEKEN